MVLIYSFYHKGNARTMTINAMQNINPMGFFSFGGNRHTNKTVKIKSDFILILNMSPF